MKKALRWYIRWTVVGNGIIALASFVIGNMIRAGWLGDNKFTEFMKWYNDLVIVAMKSTYFKNEF